MYRGTGPRERGTQKMTDDERKARDEALYARMPTRYIPVGEERIRRTRRLGWLIERVWPEGTVHLLAGPSGVGKTTWMLPAIKDWSEGKPVLGFKSYPKPFVYIMCDRNDTDLQRTLDRLKLTNWEIPAYSIESLGHNDNYMIEPDTITIESLPRIFPWAKVFFIEAYNWFYKGSSKNGAVGDYQATLRFWSKVRDHFSQRDLTIIATTHEAKGNEYTRTRDKVYGNVGQVAVAGTIMTMEFDQKDEDTRYLRIAPRDSKEFTCEYKFDESGILQFKAESSPEQKDDSAAAKLWKRRFGDHFLGIIIPTATFMIWGAELELAACHSGTVVNKAERRG